MEANFNSSKIGPYTELEPKPQHFPHFPIQNLTLRKLFHLDAADDMVTRVMMKRKGIKPVYTWLELLRIKSGSNALHCNIFWLIQLSTPALKLYRIAFL